MPTSITTDARGGANPARNPIITHAWNGHPVRCDHLGRVSLTDMWKATGGEAKDRPNYWLANQKTQDLIQEITQSRNSGFESGARFQPVVTRRGGTDAGTWAQINLAVAYAEHLSPAFWLWVTETFLAARAAERQVSPEPVLPSQFERIVRHAVEAALEPIQKENATLKRQVIEMWSDLASAGRAARANTATRRLHALVVNDAWSRMCPCCRRQLIVDVGGAGYLPGVRVERYDKRLNRARFQDVWPVCGKCYRELRREDFRLLKLKVFEGYQADAQVWLGNRGQMELEIR